MDLYVLWTGHIREQICYSGIKQRFYNRLSVSQVEKRMYLIDITAQQLRKMRCFQANPPFDVDSAYYFTLIAHEANVVLMYVGLRKNLGNEIFNVGAKGFLVSLIVRFFARRLTRSNGSGLQKAFFQANFCLPRRSDASASNALLWSLGMSGLWYSRWISITCWPASFSGFVCNFKMCTSYYVLYDYDMQIRGWWNRFSVGNVVILFQILMLIV